MHASRPHSARSGMSANALTPASAIAHGATFLRSPTPGVAAALPPPPVPSSPAISVSASPRLLTFTPSRESCRGCVLQPCAAAWGYESGAEMSDTGPWKNATIAPVPAWRIPSRRSSSAHSLHRSPSPARAVLAACAFCRRGSATIASQHDDSTSFTGAPVPGTPSAYRRVKKKRRGSGSTAPPLNATAATSSAAASVASPSAPLAAGVCSACGSIVVPARASSHRGAAADVTTAAARAPVHSAGTTATSPPDAPTTPATTAGAAGRSSDSRSSSRAGGATDVRNLRASTLTPAIESFGLAGNDMDTSFALGSARDPFMGVAGEDSSPVAVRPSCAVVVGPGGTGWSPSSQGAATATRPRRASTRGASTWEENGARSPPLMAAVGGVTQQQQRAGVVAPAVAVTVLASPQAASTTASTVGGPTSASYGSSLSRSSALFTTPNANRSAPALAADAGSAGQQQLQQQFAPAPLLPFTDRISLAAVLKRSLTAAHAAAAAAAASASTVDVDDGASPPAFSPLIRAPSAVLTLASPTQSTSAGSANTAFASAASRALLLQQQTSLGSPHFNLIPHRAGGGGGVPLLPTASTTASLTSAAAATLNAGGGAVTAAVVDGDGDTVSGGGGSGSASLQAGAPLLVQPRAGRSTSAAVTSAFVPPNMRAVPPSGAGTAQPHGRAATGIGASLAVDAGATTAQQPVARSAVSAAASQSLLPSSTAAAAAPPTSSVVVAGLQPQLPQQMSLATATPAVVIGLGAHHGPIRAFRMAGLTPAIATTQAATVAPSLPSTEAGGFRGAVSPALAGISVTTSVASTGGGQPRPPSTAVPISPRAPSVASVCSAVPPLSPHGTTSPSSVWGDPVVGEATSSSSYRRRLSGHILGSVATVPRPDTMAAHAASIGRPGPPVPPSPSRSASASNYAMAGGGGGGSGSTVYYYAVDSARVPDYVAIAGAEESLVAASPAALQHANSGSGVVAGQFYPPPPPIMTAVSSSALAVRHRQQQQQQQQQQAATSVPVGASTAAAEHAPVIPTVLQSAPPPVSAPTAMSAAAAGVLTSDVAVALPILQHMSTVAAAVTAAPRDASPVPVTARQPTLTASVPSAERPAAAYAVLSLSHTLLTGEGVASGVSAVQVDGDGRSQPSSNNDDVGAAPSAFFKLPPRA